MRLDALKAMKIQVAVFYCLHFYPEDGGSIILRNVITSHHYKVS